MVSKDLVPSRKDKANLPMVVSGVDKAYIETDAVIQTDTSSPTIWGLAILAAGIGIFIIWAAFAPLASAVVAPGVLIVEDKRKEVEHLEGGILRDILVREGQSVLEGEVLLVIDSAASTARHNQLVAQEAAARVRLARVESEFQGLDEFVIDASTISAGDDEDLDKLIDLQREFFNRRQQGMLGQLEVFDEQIKQIREEIVAHRARITADTKRLALTRERLQAIRTIFRQGHATRPQVAALEAEEADLEGLVAENRAKIAGLDRRIIEVKQEKANLKTEFGREVTSEYQEVKALLAEITQNKTASLDVVERMNVVAPISGKVVGLVVNTEGAVVTGGEKLMEIVPDNRLVVETLIRPEDIEQVHPGQSVLVRLTAFNFRTTPPVRATLVHVSADRVIDERSGVAAYQGKIELDEQHLIELSKIDLYPGMPAEAIIKQGDRTFFDYLAGPVIRVFERGLRDL